MPQNHDRCTSQVRADRMGLLAFVFLGEFTFACTFLDDVIYAAISDRNSKTASPTGTGFGTCVIMIGSQTFLLYHRIV